MRKNYLLIATIALLLNSCKKDSKDIAANQSIQSASDLPQAENLSVCTGNIWTFDQATPAREWSPTLVYNNKAYFFQSTDSNHISIFDGVSWITMATLCPFGAKHPDFHFTIGNKGYLGFSNNVTQGFWEYDFGTGAWTAKASFPGPPRVVPATFTIGNNGYLVGGAQLINGIYTNYGDTWQYDQANNVWTQKASFPFLVFGRGRATGFTIGNMGYIVNGQLLVYGEVNHPLPEHLLNSLMQYDPVSNAWTIKANFPGNPRYNSSVFVTGGLAYVGAGMINGFSSYDDYYKYYPVNDVWQAIPDIPAIGHYRPISFAINSKGYVGYDYQNQPLDIRLVKYTPRTCGIGNPGPQ